MYLVILVIELKWRGLTLPRCFWFCSFPRLQRGVKRHRARYYIRNMDESPQSNIAVSGEGCVVWAKGIATARKALNTASSTAGASMWTRLRWRASVPASPKDHETVVAASGTANQANAWLM